MGLTSSINTHPVMASTIDGYTFKYREVGKLSMHSPGTVGAKSEYQLGHSPGIVGAKLKNKQMFRILFLKSRDLFRYGQL
jgi:hypothetical protein